METLNGLPLRLLDHPVFVMLQLLRMARQRGGPPGPVPHEIRLPQYAVLAVLADLGPHSQREVADRLHYDASDLVNIIDALEEAGLVSRLRDSTDRRRYKLTVTTEGRAALEQVQERSVVGLGVFLSPLSEAERATLKDMLVRLYVHHDNAG